MASLAYSPSPAAHRGATGRPTDGILKRLMSHFATTHEAKARRQATSFASIFSDEQLASYGWSVQDIARLRGSEAH